MLYIENDYIREHILDGYVKKALRLAKERQEKMNV